MPDQIAPEKNATFPEGTAPVVAAALRNIPGIATWSRVQRLERLDHYYEGSQYDDRPYAWDGTLAADDPHENPIGVPIPADHYVPVNQRRPTVNYRLGRKITQARTELLFAGGDPDIQVDGDPKTQDWYEGAAEVGQLWRRMRVARNMSGSAGETFLVHGIRGGRPYVEALSARRTHVLAWADQEAQVPAHVLRIWCSREREINPREQTLEEVEVWFAREWFCPMSPDELATLDDDAIAGTSAPRGFERLLRYRPHDAAGPNRWELVREGKLYEMTVIPMENVDHPERLEGEGDFEGLEGLIDEAVAVLSATSGGVKRNVDPTTVVKEDPIKNPGNLRKGGHNTIFASGGAEYLQMESDGVKAGLDTFDKLKALGNDQASVTEFDPEKMSGAAQSGEALRRLLQPSISVADGQRDYSVAPAAIKVLRGWWREAKRIEKRAAVTSVTMGPAGPVTVTTKQVVRIPPKVIVDDEGKPTGQKEERVTGNGGDVRIVWPDYVDLTSQDKLQIVQMLGAAVGQKALIQLRTAVQALKATKIVSIEDVDEEVEGLLVDTERTAAANAAVLGDVAPFGKGKTPDEKPAPPGK